MNDVLFLTLEEVLSIHEAQINAFGGLHGIRDHGLLSSAINALKVHLVTYICILTYIIWQPLTCTTLSRIMLF